MHPQALPTPHNEISLFAVRAIVAGSRYYDDYPTFSAGMHDFVRHHKHRGSIIFISGRAETGADDMIIFWCRENNYPWAEFEARWDDVEAEGAIVRYRRNGDAYNVLAGHWRNGDMGNIATDLMIWWDGLSKGSRDMLAKAKKLNLIIKEIIIDIKKESHHGRQSSSRRSGDLDVRREVVTWE